MNPNQDPTRDAIAQAMMREALIRQGLQPQAERLAGRDARGNDAPVPVGADGTAGMGAQPWPLTSLGRPPEYAGVLGFQGGGGACPQRPQRPQRPHRVAAPGFGVGGSGMARPVDTGVATRRLCPGEPVALADMVSPQAVEAGRVAAQSDLVVALPAATWRATRRPPGPVAPLVATPSATLMPGRPLQARFRAVRA